MSDVTGQVVNYFTGNPISFATIKFNSFIATTDTEGKFQIIVTPGPYNIEVIHKDYELTKFSANILTKQAYGVGVLKVKPIFKAL